MYRPHFHPLESWRCVCARVQVHVHLRVCGWGVRDQHLISSSIALLILFLKIIDLDLIETEASHLE